MKKIEFPLTVAFGDCDPQGIVNYPNYFQWFDRNNERLFRAAGLEFAAMFDEYGIDGIPLVDVSSRFLAPARLGEAIVVESEMEGWRGKTFSVRHRVTRAGEVIVDGCEVRAWVVRDPDSPKGIRAAPVPAEVKARFED